MLKNYLKIALRNIAKYKLFSAINVFGLTIGIACTIIIFLWVKHQTSYNSFFSKKNQIYVLVTKTHASEESNSYTPYALSKRLAETYPEIINYTRHENNSFFQTNVLKYISEDGSNEKLFYEKEFYLGDTSFFKIFDFPFIFGNPETALNDEYSLVLTDKTAKKYFGDENPIEKNLILNNETEYTVTGVVQNPGNSSFYFDVLAVNTSVRDRNYLDGWDSNGPSFIEVSMNVSINELREKAANFLETIDCPLKEGVLVDFVPITEFHLYYGLKYLVIIIASVVILILIIACLNYINLSVALFNQRAKEVALKKIAGSFKAPVILQMLIESVIITIIAVNFAVVVVNMFLPFFNKIAESNISLSDLGSNLQIISYLFVFALVIGIISGLYPAILLSLYKPINVLKPANPTGEKVSFSRKSMIILQFVISILLVTSTLIIFKQRKLLSSKPLGFDKEYIVEIPINKQLLNHFENFRNDILKNPDIINATAASTMPLGIGNHSGVRYGNGADDIETNTKFAIIMPGYINTFGMDMVQGEAFQFDKPTSLKGYIINESAVKRYGLTDPVGKNLQFWGRDGHVIGVVKDFENNFLKGKLKPLILSANPDNWFFIKYIFVKISPVNVQKSIKFLEKTSRAFAPDFPFEYKFVDKEIAGYLKDEIRFNKIIFIFSIIALLIACFGLFGMTLFSTERRTKEIGIRKTNGARTIEIMAMLSKDYTKWVIIAYVIACPLVYFLMKQWLQIFAYKTNLSWWVFALAGLITLVISLLTVSWQSWRAASRNPVEALRYE